MRERIVHINVKDKKSLQAGAQAIGEMLGDIEARIATKSQRNCETCGDLEWMYPVQVICWRCKRIAQGLPVMKPKGEEGWLQWNYSLNAWVDEPPPEEKDLPEWGKVEDY